MRATLCTMADGSLLQQSLFWPLSDSYFKRRRPLVGIDSVCLEPDALCGYHAMSVRRRRRVLFARNSSRCVYGDVGCVCSDRTVVIDGNWAGFVDTRPIDGNWAGFVDTRRRYAVTHPAVMNDLEARKSLEVKIEPRM